MKPHNFPAAVHPGYIARLDHYTPAGGDHLLCPSTKSLEQIAFRLAEVIPTMILDNLLNIPTLLGLQFIIHIHENPAESVRD
jgi:2-methylisocitrate lyase-like PEP mutase family enzyme